MRLLVGAHGLTSSFREASAPAFSNLLTMPEWPSMAAICRALLLFYNRVCGMAAYARRPVPTARGELVCDTMVAGRPEYDV